jgi:hypothetical protein
MFEGGPRICQQSAKRKKDIVYLKFMDFIHYKKSLMLLRAYVEAFDLLIL